MLQLLLTASIFGIFALGFATIWFKNRRFASAGVLAASYATAAAGFYGEVLMSAYTNLKFLIPVNDTLFMASTALLAVGLCLRFSQPIPKKFLLLAFTVTFIPTHWHFFAIDDFAVRTEIISYGSAVMSAIGAFAVYKGARTLLDRLQFIAVSAFAAQFVITTVVAFHINKEVINLATFESSQYLEILQFTVGLIAICMGVLLFSGLAVSLIDELRRETETDVLTKLNNRRGFENLAIEAIERGRKTGTPMALILCDIDHFKSVNDKFGHAIGDEVISAFGDTLNRVKRPEDIVGRIGGEEFAMMMPVANAYMANLVAESARASFASASHIEEHPHHVVTASFGVAELQEGDTYRTLLQRADRLLYESKDQGRDKVSTEKRAAVAA